MDGVFSAELAVDRGFGMAFRLFLLLPRAFGGCPVSLSVVLAFLLAFVGLVFPWSLQEIFYESLRWIGVSENFFGKFGLHIWLLVVVRAAQ